MTFCSIRWADLVRVFQDLGRFKPSAVHHLWLCRVRKEAAGWPGSGEANLNSNVRNVLVPKVDFTSSRVARPPLSPGKGQVIKNCTLIGSLLSMRGLCVVNHHLFYILYASETLLRAQEPQFSLRNMDFNGWQAVPKNAHVYVVRSISEWCVPN